MLDYQFPEALNLLVPCPHVALAKNLFMPWGGGPPLSLHDKVCQKSMGHAARGRQAEGRCQASESFCAASRVSLRKIASV